MGVVVLFPTMLCSVGGLGGGGLLLPIYIEDETNNKYKKVIEVLRYLIIDLEIDVDDTIAALFQCGTEKRSFPVQLHLSFAQGQEKREFTITELM